MWSWGIIMWLQVCCWVAKPCPTLCSLMDCIPLSSSVDGIFLAGILGRVAISSSRGSSWPRDGTRVSCITGRFFTADPPGKPIKFKDDISGDTSTSCTSVLWWVCRRMCEHLCLASSSNSGSWGKVPVVPKGMAGQRKRCFLIVWMYHLPVIEVKSTHKLMLKTSKHSHSRLVSLFLTMPLYGWIFNFKCLLQCLDCDKMHFQRVIGPPLSVCPYHNLLPYKNTPTGKINKRNQDSN